MKNTFLLFLLFFVQILYGQDYLDEGLYFSSHEVIQDQRTSLDITPSEPFIVKNNFRLEFEANFRRGDGYYGNIFKIIGNDELNIDFAANLDTGIDRENFWLVVKDTTLFKYNWNDIPKIDFNKWIPIKIEIDTQASTIAFTINDYQIVKKIDLVKNLKELEVVFGKNNHKKFPTTDVCPMSIKNVKVFNHDDNIIRHWNLGKHTSINEIYDEIGNHIAHVTNPIWLMDQHVFWSKNETFTINNLVGTAKDEIGERIFLIGTESINIFSLNNKELETFKIKIPLQCQSNTYVFNHLKNELIAYSIDEYNYATFNFSTLEWSNSDKVCPETAYLHHTKIISPKDSLLNVFGGYGYYEYKGTFKNFVLDSTELQHFDVSSKISPRYLSSSGVLNDDSFLIFGGYGSLSGDQHINSQHYYDLYSIAFDNLQIEKKWSFENTTTSPFVPVQSMVIDSNSDSFYTLIYDNTNYNTHLKLARFGINDQKMTVYSDSIPYQFLDTKSEVEFFLNTSKTKLYTLTISENNASLYSLTYPPLFSADVFQKEIINTPTHQSYLWLLLILGALVIITFLIIYNKKRSKNTEQKVDQVIEDIHPLSNIKIDKQLKSAIYLYGGLQVFDKEGIDVTGQFTPTIKQLFLLILLYTSKNEKGISSIKLTELLWFDKSESSARNNRNVNISKLRLLLDRIGDIEINNENTYWKINIGTDVFCDYLFVNNQLMQTTNKSIKEEELNRFLNIVKRGEICPDIHTDWMDVFKNDTANVLIDNLELLSKIQKNLHIKITIADALLKFGPLNEVAITLKCKSLYDLGKKGLAKQSYNHFCNEYLELLDAKFEKSFKEIIR